MNVTYQLQAPGKLLGSFQARQKNQIMYLADLTVLFIDRADLSCYHKAY